MRTSRLFTIGTLFASVTWLLAGGCSASDGGPASGPSPSGTSGSGGSGSGDPTKLMPDGTVVDGGQLNALNPLCGVGMAAGTCVPDNESACRLYVPPAPSTGGAGGETGNPPSDSTSSNAAGAGDAGNGAVGGQGGAAGAGGEAGAAGARGQVDGGAGPSAAGAGGASVDVPMGSAAYGCQVGRANGELVRQCVEAGQGKVNAPCFGANDCAAGLACVTENDAGRCLPYCCDPKTACLTNTYCAERPLRSATSAGSAAAPTVPVCVPAEACSLDEQFPCPSGASCRCKGDTACLVVRDDGTTTCAKPGAGQQGEACPCAWNHVCSSVTHQCVKLCHTDPSKNDCGNQKCQASSELPQNFGVCVGPLN